MKPSEFPVVRISLRGGFALAGASPPNPCVAILQHTNVPKRDRLGRDVPLLAQEEQKANAEFLRDCWNAMQGIDDPGQCFVDLCRLAGVMRALLEDPANRTVFGGSVYLNLGPPAGSIVKTLTEANAAAVKHLVKEQS